VAARGAGQQPGMPVIGLLTSASPGRDAGRLATFRQGLAEVATSKAAMSRSNIAGLARRAGRLPADDSPSVANGWGRHLLEHRPRENIFVAGDCNIAGLRVDTLAPLRRGSLGNGLSNRLCGASSATNHQFGATVKFFELEFGNWVVGPARALGLARASGSRRMQPELQANSRSS
jgi:hypothetical protein